MRAMLAAFAALIAMVPGGLSVAAERPSLIPAAQAKAGQVVDLVPATIAFIDETAALPDDARVTAFHTRFDAILPNYYDNKHDQQAKFDDFIAKQLHEFPAERAKIVAAAASFNVAFARGQRHFRQFFPDYTLSVPVYLVHSMGQQDGGTRTVAGRKIMFFGADVIARIHDDTTIGPFLDHELFHVYHARYFSHCDPLWCSLWEEGMAVYVASRMNPGANDRQLALTLPRPIRPEVDAHLSAAMCQLRAKFDSIDQADYAPFFFGQIGKSNDGPFPPRYGYYLGYLMAQKIGQTMPLSAMVKLSPAQAKPLLQKALADYGTCTA